MKTLLNLSLFTGILSCLLIVISIPAPVSLFKRDFPQISVQANYWSSNYVSSVSDTAKASQLMFIGFSDQRDVQGWVSYYNNNSALFSTFDIQTFLLHSPFTSLFAALAIGLIMAILVTLFECCFCCWRGCCNMCGGRAPSEDGYTNRNLYVHFGMFLVVVAMIITFSSLYVQYSNGITVTINGFDTGTQAALTDANAFASVSAQGLVAAPNIANNVITGLINNVTTIDIPNALNSTIGSAVKNVITHLNDLASNINQGSSAINKTGQYADGIISQLNQVSVVISNVTTTLKGFQFVMILGQNYTVTGFPDLSQLSSVNVPTNSIPSLSSLSSYLAGLPDLSSYANTLNGTYINATSSVGSLLNNTLQGRVNISDFTGGLTGQITSLAATLNATTSNIYATSIRPAFQVVEQYDYYRSLAMNIPMYVIMGCTAIAALGALIKKRMLFFPIIFFIALLSWLIWVEYVLFYAVSAPVNILCNSKDAVLNQNYALSSIAGSSNFTNAFSNYSINPTAILNGCIAGQSLFNVTIDSRNRTSGDLVNSLIYYLQSQVNNYVNLSSIQGMLPNVGGQVGQISNFSVSQLNISGFTFPNVQAMVNLTSEIQTTRSTANNLDPTALDSDKGNLTTIYTKLDAFNALARSINSSFHNWTVLYIENTYVIPNVTFQGQDITGSPNDPNNPTLSYAYQNDLGPRIQFYYYANVSINNIKTQVNTQMNTLQNLQDVTLVSIQNQVNTLRNMTLNLTSSVAGQLINNTITLRASVLQIDTAIQTLSNWIVSYFNTKLVSGLQLLFSQVFINNPVQGFGNCQAVASDLNYMVDGVCEGLLGSLSGLWFCALLTGIFMTVGFIVIMRTKKRVEFLENRGKVGGKIFDTEKGNFESNFDSRSNHDVQATRPMEELEEDNLPSYSNNGSEYEN